MRLAMCLEGRAYVGFDAGKIQMASKEARDFSPGCCRRGWDCASFWEEISSAVRFEFATRQVIVVEWDHGCQSQKRGPRILKRENVLSFRPAKWKAPHHEKRLVTPTLGLQQYWEHLPFPPFVAEGIFSQLSWMFYMWMGNGAFGAEPGFPHRSEVVEAGSELGAEEAVAGNLSAVADEISAVAPAS